ncbi:MAG: UDP-4-amino-4,6-dideoxy-N-acetyl-beta-L-altrosamine N-acetyltransferase [Mesorhizobium sp.]
MNKPDGVVLHFRNVTELPEADLSKILSIRNEPPVRNNMYTSHQIGAEEHRLWVNGLRSSPDRKFFSVEHEGNIVGAAGLSAINLAHKRADWAFYISEAVHGRGIGSALEQQFLDLVFSTFDIEKLNCEVIEFNEKVIAMHERFGFRREGFRRDHVIRDGRKYGAVLLGITKAEWESRK